MNTQKRKRTRRLTVLVSVSAAVSLAAAGWAVAAPGALGVPTVGYRLAAQLTVAQEVPAVTAPAAAKGHFDALLVRTGPGRTTGVGSLPSGCKFVKPLRSGLPYRVVCAGGLVVTLPTTTGVHWMLAWRLTFSSLSGPAMAAHIHLGATGHAGPVAIALCGPCTSTVKGVSPVTPAQATTLLHGGDYVNVHTTKNTNGEIRGQIQRTTH
jgi:hypothetical protein